MKPSTRLFNLILIAVPLLLSMSSPPVRAEADSPRLSLNEAERIALQSDPLIESYAVSADGLRDEAVADGQLPDPKLKLGLLNMPVDSFARGQEPMTQLQVGIQQNFPRGRTLEYAGNKTAAMAGVETARKENRRLLVLRYVRRAYLELYYYIHRQVLLEDNRELFSQLLEITQRQYAAGRDTQHDVMRAQLELSLLDNRLLQARGNEQAARAELAQWVSHDYARRPLLQGFPSLPAVPALEDIRSLAMTHPLIRMQDAYIDAREQGVAMAEEQFKPGWMLDLTYGERAGVNVDGSQRPDMFSAMVLVDIPLFTGKRQDKRLAAARKQVAAARFTRTDQVRQLVRNAELQHAEWQQLNGRYELYEKRTLLDAKQNTEVTLKAYQNDITDFTALMRASLAELDTQLDMLQVRVDRAKAHADLLYFAGDRP